MQAAFGMFVPEEYIYDNYGNPIKFSNNTLEWERGTFLKKYGKTECTYDVNNKLVKEVGIRITVLSVVICSSRICYLNQKISLPMILTLFL